MLKEATHQIHFDSATREVLSLPSVLIVTDAWHPQVNGVVRTLQNIKRELSQLNYEVNILSPDKFFSIPCPTYPEIRLALTRSYRVDRYIDSVCPDAIHIATEGPLGIAARNYCLKNNFPFTTAFHTKFPEYLHERTRLPVNWTYSALRYFHAPASRTMVATKSLKQFLEGKGFNNLVSWSRGVDTQLFRPGWLREAKENPYKQFKLKPPIALYVGRIASEKNLEAFLNSNWHGCKVVVGDGPLRTKLSRQFGDVLFVGESTGDELASYYAFANVFAFPSKTDTFGLVLLEALASGLPVAAFPVTGPIDIITSHEVGCLHEDLSTAMQVALTLSRQDCYKFAKRYSWRACAESFFNHLDVGHSLTNY